MSWKGLYFGQPFYSSYPQCKLNYDNIQIKSVQDIKSKTYTEEDLLYTKVITSIFGKILNKEVSSKSDFFTEGGTSIHAVMIISEISDHLKYDLEIHHIYQNPTARDLSSFIAKNKNINK